MKTGEPSWKQEPNTNARKLSDRKGLGGMVQSDMKTGELATKKHSPSGKIERRSTERVARLDRQRRKASLGVTCSTL